MGLIRIGFRALIAVLPLTLACMTGSAASARSLAGVERLEIRGRADAFGGLAFGDHGVYEQIVAVAHMKIDPVAAQNRGIADLDKAPRDRDGLVAYDVDLVILRPKDPTKARRVLVYDVVNRGSKLLPTLNGNPLQLGGPQGPGDGLLMRQGYTMVWSGWQADVAPGAIGARFPVATDHGRPFTGRTEQEAVFDAPGASGAMTLPYPAATRDAAHAVLTVRARAADEPRTIDASQWSYLDDTHIKFARPSDMDAGAIYRFSYLAKDPVVAGLGFAATRDVIAFLRHAAKDQAGGANPLADLAAAPCERNAAGHCANPGGGSVDVAIAFGVSQSGRYLHDLLWQGFNADLEGRRVFDALMPNVPGARKTWTNVRFAQPGRFSRQHEDHGVFGFGFPFTYALLTDPVTGARDSLLSRCAASRTCPKIFDLDTSGEFWQAGASLMGTGGTSHDVELPANVRLFMVAGGSHYPGGASASCQNPGDPLVSTPLQRALLIDLVDWAAGRASPPASRWPSLKNGTLVDIAKLHFPDLKSLGKDVPAVVNRPEPPAGKPGWRIWVPAVDADGNDVAGVRLPDVAAPTGTYLGWNLRNPGYGAGDLCNLFGSYIPFAADEASRKGDPRRSLAARYPDKASYVAAVTRAAEALRADRLMLDEDVAAAVAKAQAASVSR